MRRLLYGLPILVLIFSMIGWFERLPASAGKAGQDVVAKSPRLPQEPASRFSPLLTDEAVRFALSLSEAQKTRIDDLVEDYRAKCGRVVEVPTSNTNKPRSNDLQNDLSRQFWTDSEKLLEPQQLTRLKQINWQLMGVNVFFDEEFRTSMHITDEQFIEMEAIRHELRSRQAKATRNLKPAQETKMTISNILSLLGDEQRQAFDRLIGPKFTFVYPSRTQKTSTTSE